MMQIFIIFHKYIFDDCYKNIPDDILDKHFTFIAVNEKIKKEYTPNKYKVINEWELPIYDKRFQERGYNENSSIYHVYVNNLHKDYDYVGFFQYDMVFKDNIIEGIKNNIIDKSVYFPLELKDFNYCSYETWNEEKTLDFIINDYEKFFNVKFSKDELYPLLNSYIIPGEKYEKIMKWVIQLYDKMYPWCKQFPYTQTVRFSHIGAIYERVMAYAIGQEKMEYKEVNVSHEHFYKSKSY